MSFTVLVRFLQVQMKVMAKETLYARNASSKRPVSLLVVFTCSPRNRILQMGLLWKPFV